MKTFYSDVAQNPGSPKKIWPELAAMAKSFRVKISDFFTKIDFF
jgi:hypothetical protein